MYPVKAFTVINAVNKATPFVLECMVRKRLEKRMEVVLNNVTSYASGRDRSALKLRSATPSTSTNNSTDLTNIDLAAATTNKNSPHGVSSSSSNSLIVLGGEMTNMGSEFVHSVQFNHATAGSNAELTDMAKNSVAMRLVRVHRDKSTGLVTLLFDVIFSPSRSFM